MSYTKPQTIDANPSGDTVKGAVVKCDQNTDYLVTSMNALAALSETLTNKTISAPTITGAVTAGGATVSGGTFTGATINASTISGPTLTGTVTAGGATITGGTAVNLALTTPTITSPTLTGTVTGTGATYSGGTISGATLTGSTVNSFCTISGSTLTGAITASGATISSPTITGATLVNTTFSGTAVMTGNSGVTKSYFYQNTAPTGWTIDNTPADALLAVKGGSQAYNYNGGNQRGTWTQPNHTHAAGTLAGPPHTHGLPFGYDDSYPAGIVTYQPQTSGTWNAGSNDSAHNNSFNWLNPSDVVVKFVSDSGGTGSVTGSTDNGATANTWRPLAQVGIIATLN